MRVLRQVWAVVAVVMLAGVSLVGRPVDAAPRPSRDEVVVTQVVAGGMHTCALMSNGTVRCWGRNWLGQLGDNTRTSRSTPALVRLADGTPLRGVTRITANADHTCALLADTTMRCWGHNRYGQLGNGNRDTKDHPVIVRVVGSAALNGVTHISAGAAHTCALLGDTTMRCWGVNTYGQLGNGNTRAHDRPIKVRVSGGSGAALSDVTQITAGGEHTCALLADTTMRCWGRNEDGQLGNGNTRAHDRPVTVRVSGGAALGGVTQIASRRYHTCAVLADTTMRCWGSNQFGQLGTGDWEDHHRPVEIRLVGGAALSDVTRITAGAGHTCAVLADTTSRCWGWNFSGQLGIGTIKTSLRPATVLVSAGGAFRNTTEIAAGEWHTCALLADATVRCWGDNDIGQFGDGTRTDRWFPVQTIGL